MLDLISNNDYIMQLISDGFSVGFGLTFVSAIIGYTVFRFFSML